MIRAHIFQSEKPATQSGKARKGKWTLEVRGTPGSIRDFETAWNASSNTLRQIRIEFDCLESAKSYADHHGLVADIDLPRQPSPRRRTYTDNFLKRAQ
jgi:hypothetical protein